MKFVGKIICMLTLTLPLEISAELLIFKLVDGKMALLDESDANNVSKIEEVLLKYQWPMVKASELTEVEQNELLTKDRLYAEEQFIQRKIHEVTGNDVYQVVFIPTTIYELFVIAEVFKTKGKDNPLQNAIKKLFDHSKMQNIDTKLFKGAIDDTWGEVHTKLKDLYKKTNMLFYSNEKTGALETAHSYVNEKLGSFLFENFPNIKNTIDALNLSNEIFVLKKDIVICLIDLLKEMHESFGGKKDGLVMPFKLSSEKVYSKNGEKLVVALNNYDLPLSEGYANGGVVMKIINLEYEARMANKGLLLRGTTFEKFGIKGWIDPTQEHLAGTSIKKREKSLLKQYKENDVWPYSISFGNSLFAGVIEDSTACVYNYLYAHVLADKRKEAIFKSVGYALLINKKDSFETDNDDLFFIFQMSSIVSLFAKGEFFHSRCKAAIAIKKCDKAVEVNGIVGDNLLDPTGVIVIERDPLEHAARFSDFFVKNGRIIQIGDEENLTSEEKQFVEYVMKNQKDVSEYYRGIKTITPWVSEVTKKWHEDLEWKAKIIQQMKNAKKQKRAEKEALKQESELKTFTMR